MGTAAGVDGAIRHANPTLAGGPDDEAARTDQCGQERPR